MNLRQKVFGIYSVSGEFWDLIYLLVLCTQQLPQTIEIYEKTIEHLYFGSAGHTQTV